MSATILVANDSDDFLDAMATLLADEGYAPVTCKLAWTVLDAMRQRQPDLVLLDVVFGREAGGFDVLRLLRATPEYVHTPVILTSAADLLHDATLGLLMRYNACFLPKPFDVTELLDGIHRLLYSDVPVGPVTPDFPLYE